MAFCKRCGAQINPGVRFCPNCGVDAAAAAGPPLAYQAGRRTGTGRAVGSIGRAAQGLGIAGGVLGVIWGGLAPYLTYKLPDDLAWSSFGTDLGRPEVGLIIGVVLGLLGVIGGIVATRSRGAATVLLLACGVLGFVLGGTWLIPGAILLVAGGLAIAPDRT